MFLKPQILNIFINIPITGYMIQLHSYRHAQSLWNIKKHIPGALCAHLQFIASILFTQYEPLQYSFRHILSTFVTVSKTDFHSAYLYNAGVCNVFARKFYELSRHYLDNTLAKSNDRRSRWSSSFTPLASLETILLLPSEFGACGNNDIMRVAEVRAI